jgi:RND family efflux transporter MFP subunit
MGSIAEELGVQATQQRELALAQLDSARAQAALAHAGVTNHVLRAPFAGTITQAPNGVGAVVASGQTLFTVVDTSKLKLATTVSEDDANLLFTGAKVRVSTERGEHAGRITAVLGTLDARTRRVPVVAELDNAPRTPTGPTLRAGAFVRAAVDARDTIEVLRVPHTVLRPGSRDEVLVVEPEGSRLSLRRVAYAIDRDGTLLVRSGISAEDRLVVAPIPEAKAGDVVRVVAPTPDTPKAPEAAKAGAP